MKKYNVYSTICLGIFIILFYSLINGVFLGPLFGPFGRIAIFSMFLFPLLGVIFGIKGKKGFGKWLLTILNVTALIAIGYIALLSGMGEA